MGESEATHHGSADRHDDFAAVLPDDPQRIEASAGIECINCAVCYAACDTVAGNPDYLGPAALQRAWTLYNDSVTRVARPYSTRYRQAADATTAIRWEAARITARTILIRWGLSRAEAGHGETLLRKGRG